MLTNEQTAKTKKLYDFLQSNNKSHYLQSPEWAKVKANWKHEMLVVENNGKIIGTMSVLLKKTPLLNSYMMYAPRGFICDSNNKEALEKLTEEVKKTAKKYNAFIFRMDSDIPDSNNNFKEMMKSLGYKLKTESPTIQPQFVYRLDIKNKTQEELLKSFRSKTRYNINLAIRKNVKVREAQKSDIPIFHKILKHTAKRDKFYVHDISYYERIIDNFGPNNAKIFIAEYENEPIAAAMCIFYGNKTWYLYGGSTDKYRNYMPTYLLQWTMIKWAIEKNCDIYDFGGVSGYKNENNPMYGVYRFKKGFNGEVVKFTNELYLVFKPEINTIYNIMSDLYSRFSDAKKYIERNISSLKKRR
ncbi:MAG: peptidoglycan bridge formation glycyltransferase FemA/FemB family protein [Eubacterium sp.]|nr:peptidoglycan bridge formation glycyltransferase FemA/FemB family protein [Eubacterium sp.]